MAELSGDEKELIQQGDSLFAGRPRLMSLWQESAENFYPQRADFLTTRLMGDTFADNLTTSSPLLASRDLANAISGLMRPSNKMWGSISVEGIEEVDLEGRRWLEKASLVVHNVLYRRETRFVRAAKEVDADFTVFGQGVMQRCVNRQMDGLVYKSHHLRDCVWSENDEGVIDTFHRKWTPRACDLVKMFPDKVSPEVTKLVSKDPFALVECRHVIVPNNDGYKIRDDKVSKPYISYYFDVKNGVLLEKEGVHDIQYIVPRWQTVSGSQYAYSPALIAALPDARLIQSITLTLLEAGEKAANPPMLATQDAIQGDVNVFAGGLTWVDAAYDERLGEVLRPLTQNYSGLPMAMDLSRDIKLAIQTAFFLDKINLPMMTGERTAFEISQRVSEYIRNAAPLFEPLEHDYNGAIYEMTFNELLRRGTFGAPNSMPKSLSGRELKFVFDSPLTQALGQEKSQKFM
jgi:hypothetical protein